MCCVQTNKTDHIYFAQFFFVAENIGLFFSLSIFKNFSNQFFMTSTVAMEQLVYSTKGYYAIKLKTFGYIEGPTSHNVSGGSDGSKISQRGCKPQRWGYQLMNLGDFSEKLY